MSDEHPYWSPGVFFEPGSKAFVKYNDFRMDLNAFDVFNSDGTHVLLPVEKIAKLMQQQSQLCVDTPAESAILSKRCFESNVMRNFCFKEVQNKHDFVKILQNDVIPTHYVLYHTVALLLKKFKRADDGNYEVGFFRKRYSFHSFLINNINCNVCNNSCIFKCVCLLYENDQKCIKHYMNDVKYSCKRQK